MRFLLFFIAAASTGCGSTEPAVPKHAMVGTWAITTQLVSYTAPDTATSCVPPNCPRIYTTPSPGASLRGILVIADSVLTAGDTVRFPVTIPTMMEADCGVALSCATRSVSYFSSGLLFVRDTQPRWSQHVTNSNDTLQGEVLRFAYGRFTGDSIAGTVVWFPSNGYGWRSYNGTFVARRQR